MSGHDPYGQMFPWPPPRPDRNQQRNAALEREVAELRDIIAAMMIKYAPRELGSEARRTVLNPDVTGSVESSLLLVDTSHPGMVILRYGAA